MRTPPDLHPDDYALRIGLRDMLAERRLLRNWSPRDLARAMGMASSAWKLEVHTAWRLSTVQQWAYALGLRLYLAPDCLPPDERLYLLRPADSRAALAYDRLVWIEQLTEARRWVGISQMRIGDRLSITDRGVAAIEKAQDILLLNAQRYCRAIGSELIIEVEEVRP